MAEERPDTKSQKEDPGKEAGAVQKGGKGTGKDEPVRKPSGAAFSKKGLLILGAVVGLEAVIFLLFLSRTPKGAGAAGPETPEMAAEAAHKKDIDEFLHVGRSILDLGEIKVPITSTQPRAPRSVSATIQVVITKELSEKLAGGGGGHGGGGKESIHQKVLILNVRSILRDLMDSDGIRMVEPSAKNDFMRRAKDQLNNMQIDGDEEKAQVLKVMRGQVLQVLVDKFEAQSY